MLGAVLSLTYRQNPAFELTVLQSKHRLLPLLSTRYGYESESPPPSSGVAQDLNALNLSNLS